MASKHANEIASKILQNEKVCCKWMAGVMEKINSTLSIHGLEKLQESLRDDPAYQIMTLVWQGMKKFNSLIVEFQSDQLFDFDQNKALDFVIDEDDVYWEVGTFKESFGETLKKYEEWFFTLRLLMSNKDCSDEAGLVTSCMPMANYTFAQIFLRRGANPNVIIDSKSSRTLLMFMCRMNNTDIVLLLVEHQADLDLRDASNKTAQDYVSSFSAINDLINIIKER